jgi:hypothetical protein
LTKRLGPFFKYYGSKYRIAPQYPAPKFRDIIEPFAGSASYSTLHASHQVILVERDPDISAVWKWLINADASAVRALPHSLPQGLDIRDLDVPHEAKLLIRQWQRVGHAKCWTISKWGHMSGFWCETTRDRIAAQVSAIRHWQVYECDITAYDLQQAATWFLDPPYQTQATVYGGEGTNFQRLARWTHTRRGQVIVCEAPGADWLPFRHLTNATVGPSGSGKCHAKRAELIWTNDPPALA